MEAPSIQYAKASDGVSIAYAVSGEGTPFISMPPIPFAFTVGHSQVPEWHAWNEQIARRRMLVRYDCRGAGLSDRDVSDYSLDAWLLDIEAVVEDLGLDQLVLFAPGSLAVPVAIAYAARWPERVSHLILWQAYAQAPGPGEQLGSVGRAIMSLLDKDWVLFTETMAHSAEGWSEPETARRSAALMRENHTPRSLRAAFAASAGLDVAGLLPEVRARTLVLHRRESSHDLSQSKHVATSIPHARLVVVEGSASSWALQHPETVLQAMDEFLAEGEARRPMLPSGMTAILFTDIVDSTALTERMGDTAFRSASSALDARLRDAIREAGGTAIDGKLLGDGILATFPGASQAIAAAVACRDAGEAAGLPLHLGVHAGDVIREEDNVYGGAVNIASRIAAASAPGEILVSDTVRSLARTSAGVAFEDRGEHEMKGIAEPVRVYAVRQQLA